MNIYIYQEKAQLVGRFLIQNKIKSIRPVPNISTLEDVRNTSQHIERYAICLIMTNAQHKIKRECVIAVGEMASQLILWKLFIGTVWVPFLQFRPDNGIFCIKLTWLLEHMPTRAIL